MRQASRSASTNSTATDPVASHLWGIERRAFLAGALSLASVTALSRKGAARDALSPAFAAAAKLPGEGYAILILAADGTLLREVPLSARGHDIALDKANGRAVAFARRPGTFAVAFDLPGARAPAIFHAMDGRHFYGHGCFSRDGRLLYVSENDIAAGRGVIGIYDVEAGYKRRGEMPSHGVGPHEIILLADGRTLGVANGGIDTVPEAGRAMLDLDGMRPNLAFVDAGSGALVARHELSSDLNRLSIRHIAADADGAVWFGGQWEGDLMETPELVGRASRDRDIRLIEPDVPLGLDLKGYIGSIAASGDGRIVAASAPKAGRILYIASATGEVVGEGALADGCGIAGETDGRFAVTSGLGVFRRESPVAAPRLFDERTLAGIAFDNHLRRI